MKSTTCEEDTEKIPPASERFIEEWRYLKNVTTQNHSMV
jgi:hypothetical protein